MYNQLDRNTKITEWVRTRIIYIYFYLKSVCYFSLSSSFLQLQINLAISFIQNWFDFFIYLINVFCLSHKQGFVVKVYS